ncbi:MAG: hypothetical protein JWN56_897 [Sphingobacteriales bacterium]|nr:hypothetical protein [Sphingobacteriales bacterium]
MIRKIYLSAGVVMVFLIMNFGCKNQSDFTEPLFKKFHNEVFKHLDTAGYSPVFVNTISDQKTEINNIDFIAKYYAKRQNEPVFILKLLPNGGMKIMLDYFRRAPEHGLNPEVFNYYEIKKLVDKFYDKREITTPDEAYHTMALLELKTAESLIAYSNALQYGVVSPRKIFERYFTKTPRPDSTFMMKSFNIKDISEYLESIQPTNPDYLKLQNALKSNSVYPGLSLSETQRIIKLNLERLRWKNKPAAKTYVMVNIPDYTLQFVKNGSVQLKMKVCVGKGREQEVADTAENAGIIRNHQTPELSSMIYNAQVNPVWNIPQSIAKNEIYDKVRSDPDYLINHEIDVYDKRGQKMDADSINWDSIPKNKIPFNFKQAPGDDNSLGKIKFQFVNGSNVYLHDTPAKEPFSLKVRAVSHGCVRLEKPLELARALFGSGSQYSLIETRMSSPDSQPLDLAVEPPVPVFLTYITCFYNEQGKLVIRPDVYERDAVLYERIKKKLSE